MSATTATSSNKFAAAVAQHAQFATGDNGALVKTTSGNVFVDYFTNITRDTSRETIAEAVRQMVDYARVMFLASGDTCLLYTSPSPRD